MMFGAFQDPLHQPFYQQGENGKAILFVHGFPGSPMEMRPPATIFQQRGWTTQGILLPGFASEIETIMHKQHTDWAAAVAHALQALQATHDTVVLAGNSMGGGLSIHATAQYGADALILFAPFWRVEHLLWDALPLLKHVLPTFRPFSVFKPNFNDPQFQKGTRNFMPNADFNDPEFQRQTLALEVHTNVFAQIREVGLQAYQSAPQVTCPILIIQGTQDELVRPRSTRKLTERLRGEIEYIEVAAPHNPIQPELASWQTVEQALTRFAARIEDTHS